MTELLLYALFAIVGIYVIGFSVAFVGFMILYVGKERPSMKTIAGMAMIWPMILHLLLLVKGIEKMVEPND